MSQLMFRNLFFVAFLFYFALGSPLQSVEQTSDVETATAPKDSYEERLKLLTGNVPLPKCKQNKEDFTNCFKRIYEVIQPRIRNGIPELNIPPTEPVKLNRTTFQFQLPIASGRLTMKNAEIHGMSTSQLKSADMKIEGNKAKFTSRFFTPKLRIVGDYKAQIRLSTQTTFKPKGKFELDITNIDNTMHSEGDIFEKDGHKFVRLTDFDTKPKIGDLKVNITGVFDDPELNELALSVAKGYWREIYAIMLPETRDYWAPLALRLTNEALSVIPFDVFIESK